MTARSLLAAVLAAVTVTTQACDNSPGGFTPSTGSTPNDSTPEVCLDTAGVPLPIAPDSERVDLEPPSFSNPLQITNPLFPISGLFRAILVGNIEGVPLRIETTLMPGTTKVNLNGQRVETHVSQFVAYLGGRIHEVALDRYAQADDGAVWYFGEDVFDYEDGVITDTEGTWLAGKDGPPAMIMPARPQVGDVWRPENICGLVFEEVTAESTDVTVQGPHGSVTGALVVQELHQDATLEPKTFAPGYGEFRSGGGLDLEALALAIPADALPGLPPKALETMSSGAAEIFDAAQTEDWEAAAAAAEEIAAAWDEFRAGGVPPLLEPIADSVVAALRKAVDAQEAADARQAAIDVARASLDFKLRYRTAAETDLDLLDLWARQLLVDAEAGDQAGVLGDAASIKWTRDRISQDIAPGELTQLDAGIAGVQAAAAARDLTAASHAAAGLRSTVRRTHVIARPDR
jgi:hypothetical protein